jgi:hypothetical protein
MQPPLELGDENKRRSIFVDIEKCLTMKRKQTSLHLLLRWRVKNIHHRKISSVTNDNSPGMRASNHLADSFIEFIFVLMIQRAQCAKSAKWVTCLVAFCERDVLAISHQHAHQQRRRLFQRETSPPHVADNNNSQKVSQPYYYLAYFKFVSFVGARFSFPP